MRRVERMEFCRAGTEAEQDGWRLIGKRRNPVGVGQIMDPLPRVARRRGTLGLGTESRWDSSQAKTDRQAKGS